MPADLSVTIVPGGTGTLAVAGTRAYTITARNLNTSTESVSNVQVVIGGLSSIVVISGVPVASQGGFSGNIWTIGTLAINQSVTLTLTIQYNAVGVPGVFAAISGFLDSLATNSFDTVYVRVGGPAGNAAANTTYTSAGSSLPVGSTSTFTITYQKTGGAAATNVHVYFPLPAGVNLISATPSVGSVSGTDWTIGSVAAADNATKTLTLSLQFVKVGIFTLGDVLFFTEQDSNLAANNSAFNTQNITGTTVSISDVNLCCNPIKPGSQFQTCFSVAYSDLALRQKNIYVYLSDVLQVSDQFSDVGRHCYCLTAPSSVGSYTVKIQAVDVLTPTISDIQTQTLYVANPTCPPYATGYNGLLFTPAAAGTVSITGNLSDALNRVFVQHQLVSCSNCCCSSFVVTMQSDLNSLIGFIDRTDLVVGSAAYQLRQLISSNKPNCC